MVRFVKSLPAYMNGYSWIGSRRFHQHHLDNRTSQAAGITLGARALPIQPPIPHTSRPAATRPSRHPPATTAGNAPRQDRAIGNLRAGPRAHPPIRPLFVNSTRFPRDDRAPPRSQRPPLPAVPLFDGAGDPERADEREQGFGGLHWAAVAGSLQGPACRRASNFVRVCQLIV